MPVRSSYALDAGNIEYMSDVMEGHAQPYLAALRYTDAGLAKFALWSDAWEQQRREDAGENLRISVPPKYDSKDFRSGRGFQLRGKLERALHQLPRL